MDKEVAVHIYIVEYSTVKKTNFESVELRWMSQEPDINSEVSQREEKSYIIPYTRNLEKWY